LIIIINLSKKIIEEIYKKLLRETNTLIVYINKNKINKKIKTIVVLCYKSRANKYYSLRIALHKIIRKKRSINKIKIIKMT